MENGLVGWCTGGKLIEGKKGKCWFLALITRIERAPGAERWTALDAIGEEGGIAAAVRRWRMQRIAKDLPGLIPASADVPSDTQPHTVVNFAAAFWIAYTW